MSIEVPFNFTPRPPQVEVLKALDSGIRRVFLRWHRQAGKDMVCFCYIVREAVRVPGNYFYVFPTSVMAKRALWENVNTNGFKMLDHLPKSALASKPNNQELLLSLKNNSTIRLTGLDDDPEKIRGVNANGAVFSEFAFSDPQAYINILPSIRNTKGFILINSTPNGRNHFFEMEQRVKDSPDWYVSVLQTMYPNQPYYSGFVTAEEIEKDRVAGIEEDQLEREYGVSYNTAASGSYYGDLIERAYQSKRIGDFGYDDTYPVYTYWDIGYKDDIAIWFSQISDNKVFFIDHFCESGQTPIDIVQMLHEKGYYYQRHFLPHDARQERFDNNGTSTVAQIENLLYQHNIPGDVISLPKTNSTIAGINATRMRFSHYHFDKFKCAKGIEAIEAYHKKFDRQRRVYLKTPVHDWSSHSADALRIEAQACAENEYASLAQPNPIQIFSEYDILS